MSYIVYHIQSTKRLDRFPGTSNNESFATQAAARSALTRASKKNLNIIPQQFAVAESSTFYKEIEKTEMVKNLMSGVMVEQSVNTPLSCDVSRETYWSM